MRCGIIIVEKVSVYVPVASGCTAVINALLDVSKEQLDELGLQLKPHKGKGAHGI